MILNKLQSLSWPRLLHVALSLLCALALVLGLASGALAAAGDSSGNISDFTVVSYATVSSASHISSAVTSSTSSLCTSRSIFVLPAPLSSGKFLNGISLYPADSSSVFLNVYVSLRAFNLAFYDYFGNFLSSTGNNPSFPISVPAGTSLIRFVALSNVSSSVTLGVSVSFTGLDYSDFVFEDMPFSSEILSGLTAIAQSLLDLESGPYSGVSGVSVDQYGDLQHTVVSNASLEDLLNALGIAGTDTNHVLRGIYNNFGSYFTLYSINDTTSSTTQIYRGLPQYVNALGQIVTDGINRLQRDHDLLYQQTSDLASDLDAALYADTDTSPSQSWSVAEWLKGIYNSITSFFASFWSPAETDLKEAAEEGMQEAADRDIAGSADQVGDMDDLGSGFASFGDTGNVGAGDLLDSLTGGDYSFFSSITQQNLAYHPPQQNRGFRSAPPDPDQVEYVDELSEKRDVLREVLGLP